MRYESGQTNRPTDRQTETLIAMLRTFTGVALKRGEVRQALYVMTCREAGVARRVERAMVIDDEGRVVIVERETTGVVVENDEGQAVAVVKTAVRGLVLGDRQQQPTPASNNAAAAAADVSCCGCVSRCLLAILCLPCLLVYCCCRCCRNNDDD